MKTNRKYLFGLIALVIVAMLGTIGGMAFATVAPVEVSNSLTLGGDSAPAVITLEWAGVGGGTVSGIAADVTWYVDSTYPISVKATNTTDQTIDGVYGQLTGWSPSEFKLEFLNEVMGSGHWTNLGAGDTEAGYCGFFIGSIYYFGPMSGDSYATGHTDTFDFRITPQEAIDPISFTLVLVNGVSDPR